MTKMFYKFLLLSGIILNCQYIYCAEKAEKEKDSLSKHSTTSSKTSKRTKLSRDLDLAEKKPDYPDRFVASQCQRILSAPLSTQDAQSGRWVKTERVLIHGTPICWVSIIVNDHLELAALRESIHPLLAEFIFQGNQYGTTAADAALDSVKKELVDTQTVSTFEKVTFLRKDLIAIKEKTSETAILLKSKGQMNAASDKAIYFVMVGETQLMMRKSDKWTPAKIRLNITYNAPEPKPSSLGISSVPSPIPAASTAPQYLELSKGTSPKKGSGGKRPSEKKRQEEKKGSKKSASISSSSASSDSPIAPKSTPEKKVPTKAKQEKE